MGSELSSLLIASTTKALGHHELLSANEPDAVVCSVPAGTSLNLYRSQLRKWTEYIEPHLNLRSDKFRYKIGLPCMTWALVENISKFPVIIVPTVFGGRSLTERNKRMPLVTLGPGEVHKLTRLSVDDESYRMRCYESGLPHLPCSGISQKVDPTSIVLACYPAKSDFDQDNALTCKNSHPRPETWIIYIDHVDDGKVSKFYLRYEIVKTSARAHERSSH